MIKLSQIRMPVKHTEKDLLEKAGRLLRIPPESIKDFRILKKSIDARKKEDIYYMYTAVLSVSGEAALLKKRSGSDISIYQETSYFSNIGVAGRSGRTLKNPPLVVGSGPAGLFCAYLLAKAGLAPLVIERGADMDARIQSVQEFFDTGVLDSDTNVQFGEGGAGTFSDGKLNTLVKDPFLRSKFVLDTFAAYGAPEEIRYLNKPHIGTDILRGIIRNMRNDIIKMGGSFAFHTCLTGIHSSDGRLCSVTVQEKAEAGTVSRRELPCTVLVLAVGHSARDTFALLKEEGFALRKKAFAVGLRIEHRQKMIDEAQYGKAAALLPPADYKLTHQTAGGRGVYTFCMCPGGYVVNASSEPYHTAVNGMSNHDRAGSNANSAVIVTVGPEDFPSEDVLAGIEFQRKLEQAAYQAGNGKIPVQLFGDYVENRPSTAFGGIQPQTCGAVCPSNLRDILPAILADSLMEGIQAFDRKIKGFASGEALLSGIETRTSSPVRILRNDAFEAAEGIYPCGEGAGYAGGIMSAAMDGMKAAEAILKKYD